MDASQCDILYCDGKLIVLILLPLCTRKSFPSVVMMCLCVQGNRVKVYFITCPQILQEIEEHGVKIYRFPDSGSDEEEAVANKKLRVREGGERRRGGRDCSLECHLALLTP